ncbi:carboxy terminal-processing peptidase [Methyloradius palustris]|uniref:carboxy terminal-processing peptidase n=1 Tax=Methyloradius palustris TaxID=2778876 RepID=UPI00298F7B1B|nr:carboxy terminal-processing peptidase [Methyloradius palustris]
MKKITILVLLAFAIITQAATMDSAAQFQELKPTTDQARAAHLSAEVLTRYHYSAIPLDDEASKKIFDAYIKSLDGEKMFFTQQDIDQLSEARTHLDDAILNENLSIPFAIFNLYKLRLNDRLSYAKTLLNKGFDFTAKESYQYERENEPWVSNEADMQELWRKRVKNDWLRLKLAGKDDKTIVDVLTKRYDSNLKSVTKLKGEDVFQSFMNAYAMAIDPHSNYFGVRASEDFDISMRLSLDGIGAVLEDKDEYTTIRELVPGGPAALSGKLKTGDRILGVGQGKNAPVVDVTGWRLDDTVALIRGATDSEVVLEILPAEAGADGKHTFISLIRKKISLEKQDAKKSVIEVKDGSITRKIGVITLPVFYQDFGARGKGDKDYKSASRDVATLIDSLKKDNIDSLLIDLRNNGGGSLDEAIKLTGLFIDQGPVLQERDSKGNVQVDADKDTGVLWDKPMGVLINRSSASASEIFAAAIQDYGRGIIIGETSFGKGTVQTVVNLDEIAKNKDPQFGELKMTVAQFFRINGGTTQLKGVTPDITLPTITDPDTYGESSFKNALPWTQIKPADYQVSTEAKAIVPALIASHDARIAQDKDFQYLKDDIADLNVERKKNSISLNLAERQKQRDDKNAKLAAREGSNGLDKTGKVRGRKEAIISQNASAQDDGLQSNERNIKDDLAIEKAQKDAKDVLLSESAHILSDEIGLLKTSKNASVQN